MQVSVEVTSDLGRRIMVETPSDAVDQQVETRLKGLGSQVKIDGFRPGKVPVSVIRQRYGSQVRSEVLGEIVQSSLQQALTQESLEPVGAPSIESIDEADGQVKFVADFEILPEIDITGLETLKIVKPVAAVKPADIDDMVETLRKQRAEWKESDRAAERGDQVTVNFVGRIDGDTFEGGSAEGIELELGSGRMIPGFEDQLVGVSTGGSAEVKVDFPADYTKQDLAGKPAVFLVDVIKVASPELPEVDSAFFKSFNIGDGTEESFRQEVGNNMEIELNSRLSQGVKDQVMQGLLDLISITVPQTLVDQETQRLATAAAQATGGAGSASVEPGSLEASARRRVTLGMLLSEIVKISGLQPDAERVRTRIDSMAQSYEQPEEVVQWYYSDQEQFTQVQNAVMEEQIVDWIIEKANVTEEKASFSEIVAPRG